MSARYERPPERYDGLRLHQNENTGGCSPRVIEALAALRPDQLAFYPPYARAIDACAAYYGVDPATVLLTNGLDEGIMALAVAQLRPSAGAAPAEVVVPEPAFAIFTFDTEVAGGTVVRVMPRADFSFPLEAVLAATTPRTRIVFVTNPNNPTGVSTPIDAIRAIAARVPKGAIVFVDEAYAEFSGRTFIPELPHFPNVVIGRTFSKAFGLAGIRIGCLIGHPDTLEPIRHALPVYSVNVAAVVAVQAALADRAHMERCVAASRESKALVYDACARLGLTCWTSDANFVLIRVGARLHDVIGTAAARGVWVCDRSREPGCDGCVRVTAGVVAHTRQFLDIMEEVLCAAQ